MRTDCYIYCEGNGWSNCIFQGQLGFFALIEAHRGSWGNPPRR
jgi:hypothetical protein